MASNTYACRGLVVRKTKLGEADLIVELASSDGSSVRAVAKGARKPSSQFSSRLELYSEVDLLVACGKSLDIVKEARMVNGNGAIRTSYEKSVCANCMCELLSRLTQPGLPVDRLYECSIAFLASLEQASEDCLEALFAAYIFKLLSFSGLRPSFCNCSVCGEDLKLVATSQATRAFSFSEGGSICGGCANALEATRFDANLLDWCDALLLSRFSQISEAEVPASVGTDSLNLAHQLLGSHLGIRLKSIRFLTTQMGY